MEGCGGGGGGGGGRLRRVSVCELGWYLLFFPP